MNPKNATRPTLRKQCTKCPWKVSTNPHDIPGGYCSLKHEALGSTLAAPGSILQACENALHIMACHETPAGEELPCVGWLHHQLGVGNNLGLRMACSAGQVDGNYELVGDQHETLSDTLPRCPTG